MSMVKLAQVTIALTFMLASMVAGGEIHDAVSEGNLELTQGLIQGDPFVVGEQNDRGRTPLHIAALKGHVEVASELIKAGADLEALDNQGLTPVLAGCMNNQYDIIELLARSGANLTIAHPVYGSAIDLAYWQECIKGKSGLTEFLLAQGIHLDPGTRFFGVTRLNLASTFNNRDMARLMIDLGADVNGISNSHGQTELGFAVQCGNIDVVEVLMANGADVHALDQNGDPPIRFAVEKGFEEIFRMMVAAGAEVDFVDSTTGKTLLHTAALNGYSGITSVLLARGLDANAVDKADKTPLFYAGKYGHRDVADLLVESGAVQPKMYQPNFGSPADLTREYADGEATLWQLIRRGWAMKTKDHLLVFDAEEFHTTRPDLPSLTNGCLTPSELKDQNVVAIYSTYHGRPGEPAYIHQIEDSLEQVLYIQSKLDMWKGCKNTVYIGPDEEHQFDQLSLSAYQTEFSNPALGHLIQVDGLTILYLGFAPEDLEKFKTDAQQIKEKIEKLDILFVPVTQSGEDFEAAQYMLSEFRPKMVVITDTSRRLKACHRLAEKIAEWGFDPDVKVHLAWHPGDHFSYKSN